MAMMAITTRSSMRVKALLEQRTAFLVNKCSAIIVS